MNKRRFISSLPYLACTPLSILSGCDREKPSVTPTSPSTPITVKGNGWIRMPIGEYNALPPLYDTENLRPENFFEYTYFDLSDSDFLASIGQPSLLPQVLSQGSQPSCTAWAVGYAAGTCLSRVFSSNPLLFPLSPSDLFTKLQQKLAPNACSSGATISQVMDILVQEGVSSIISVPYNEYNCISSNGTSSFVIDGFSRVSASNILAIQVSVQRRAPVCFGLYVNNLFSNLKGKGSVFRPDGTGGGHALAVVGYDNRSRLLKVMNSWGKDWGDDGFFWISYDDFAKYAIDVCIPHKAISTDNQIETSASTGNSKIKVEYLTSRRFGQGKPSSYGIGTSFRWNDVVLLSSVGIAICDPSKNILFRKDIPITQVARGIEFNISIPDSLANFVDRIRVFATGSDRDKLAVSLSADSILLRPAR